MKAAVLDGVDQPLVVREAAEPALVRGGALVHLEAAALNRRDVWIRQGLYPSLKLPIIPGSDGTGIVSAVGDPADREWVGRPVIINPALDWGPDPRVQGPDFRILGMPDAGTFAEAIGVPVANLVPRPAHLSIQQAAALPLSGLTVWRALFFRGGLRAGETVLVTGVGGGGGLTALQFALAAGARVYVTSGSDEKLERARGMGASGGVNYRAAGWPAQLERQAGRFDLVVDSTMGEAFASLVELTRPGGRIVFFGATAGNPPAIDARKLFFRQLSLHGTTMGSPADFSAMVAFVSEHAIEPVIDTVMPLDEADTALRRLETGVQFGKIVLAP